MLLAVDTDESGTVFSPVDEGNNDGGTQAGTDYVGNDTRKHNNSYFELSHFRNSLRGFQLTSRIKPRTSPKRKVHIISERVQPDGKDRRCL
jgi:hypothetical protein